MKCLVCFMLTLSIGGCAVRREPVSRNVPADVGVVNHTGNFIYSASVDGTAGGNTPASGAGMPGICCAPIPAVWYPGMKVAVRWDMPEGHPHIVKETAVEVEKYENPGSIYMHFFPNDEVRVIVSGVGAGNPAYPIPHSDKPNFAS